MVFITPVHHPNIDNGGRICLDILNMPPKVRGGMALQLFVPNTVMTISKEAAYVAEPPYEHAEAAACPGRVEAITERLDSAGKHWGAAQRAKPR